MSTALWGNSLASLVNEGMSNLLLFSVSEKFHWYRVYTFFENVSRDESWAEGLYHVAGRQAGSMSESPPCDVTRVRDDLYPPTKGKSNFTGDV